MTKHSALPVLTEVAPDHFVFRYRDADGALLQPHLALRWEEDTATWQVLDTEGRPFRGSVRLLLLRHLAAAFAAAFSPRVRTSLERAIARAEDALLLTRGALDGAQ